MDTIAHGLWAAGLGRFFRFKTKWWILGLVSMGPDLVWLPFTFLHVITSGRIYFFQGPYNISHSLIIWASVTLLATIRWRHAIAVTWPWAFHILIDIVGHTHMYTPIFWPISRYKIPGHFDWLDLRWMIANYSVMIVAGVILWRLEHRRRTRKTRQLRT